MKQAMAALTMVLGVLLLASCATTRVMDSHPLYAQPGEPRAVVYFLRPVPQRTRGIADGDITIELEQRPVMALSRGEYARIDIRPTTTNVVIRSLSHHPYQAMPMEVWRTRPFKFEAGKTYYILARFQQEEFRGVFFVPTAIDEEQARRLARNMTPAGQLAKAHPLAGKIKKTPDDSLEDLLD